MGGHVFAGGSSPIRKEDIKPTLTRFIQNFIRVFPKAKGHFEGIKTLGSVGKKDVSGDIDLALDEKAFSNIKDWGLNQKDVDTYFTQFQKRARSASKQQLMKRAIICCISDKLEAESTFIKTDTKSAGNGTLFCQFPQFDKNGKFLDKEVQIDINIGNIDWLSFAYYSDSYQGNVKGLHRTQLMLSLFTHKGYTFSHNYGVKNKETGEFERATWDEALDLIASKFKEIRKQYGSDALAGFGQIYKMKAKASGVIPQISAIFGNCGGGVAVMAAMSDFTFMEHNVNCFAVVVNV